MLKAVLLQACFALLGTLLGAGLYGTRGAISAAFSGLACVVPNFLFALKLHAVSMRGGNSQAVVFLVGEALKIASTIVVLALVPLVYPGVHWGAVVMGLILTLQANFLALLVKP